MRMRSNEASLKGQGASYSNNGLFRGGLMSRGRGRFTVLKMAGEQTKQTKDREEQKCSHGELTRLIVEQQPSRKSDGDG